mgnify:CR=1 FL=1
MTTHTLCTTLIKLITTTHDLPLHIHTHIHTLMTTHTHTLITTHRRTRALSLHHPDLC